MDAWPDSERSGCLLLPLHHASIDGTFGGQRTAGPSGSWAKIRGTGPPVRNGIPWSSIEILKFWQKFGTPSYTFLGETGFNHLTISEACWRPTLRIPHGHMSSILNGKPVNHGKPKHNTLAVSRYKMRMKLGEKSVFLYDANNHDPLYLFSIYFLYIFGWVHHGLTMSAQGLR